ncbi:bacterio-opsin activator [Sulfolobus sp. SCGC AB-777_L09]|jgi:hypothetical protein|nr:helix-turn-helix domain-containing protein [Stygiolobus sp.]MDT7876910.1 helix-turn-helix domain-containing protein [Sulfolobaceae archaeon]PVU69424.1 bacterio-opsin activator [Sulfolobus sp. SCGC AB-777_L09]
MVILHVVIKTPIEDWVLNLDWYRNSLTILDIKEDENGYRLLIEIKGNLPDNFQNSFSRVGKNVYLGSLRVNSKICSILSKYIVSQGTVISDSIAWTIILDGYSELKKLLKEFIDSKIEVKVMKVVKVKQGSIITARQEQIVKIALETGFYDFPRRITLRKLAEKLNVSPSTLSEILRRAEKNIIETYFRERGL